MKTNPASSHIHKNTVQKSIVQKMLSEQIAAIENRAEPGVSYKAALEKTPNKTDKTASGKATSNKSFSKSFIPRLPLGIEKIDHALDVQNGQGMVVAGLHEIYSPTTLSFSSALGFGLILANTLARAKAVQNNSSKLHLNSTEKALKQSLSDDPIFWIGDQFCLSEGGWFYGPGLHTLGIDPDRIIHIRVENLEEAIWVAGEISRNPTTAFSFLEVRGNPHKLDLATTRRLLLRCQRSGSSLFILRQGGHAQTSAVNTRWQITPWHSQKKILKNRPFDFGQMIRWHVKLEKCRGGRPGQWILEWNHHEQTLQPTHMQATHMQLGNKSEIRTPLETTFSGHQPAPAGKRPYRTEKMGNIVALERAS